MIRRRPVAVFAKDHRTFANYLSMVRGTSKTHRYIVGIEGIDAVERFDRIVVLLGGEMIENFKTLHAAALAKVR